MTPPLAGSAWAPRISAHPRGSRAPRPAGGGAAWLESIAPHLGPHPGWQHPLKRFGPWEGELRNRLIRGHKRGWSPEATAGDRMAAPPLHGSPLARGAMPAPPLPSSGGPQPSSWGPQPSSGGPQMSAWTRRFPGLCCHRELGPIPPEGPTGQHRGLPPAAGAWAGPDPSPTTQQPPRVPLCPPPSSLGCNFLFFFFSVDLTPCFLSLCHFTSSYVFLHFHTVVMGRSEVGSCQNLLIPCTASLK